MAPASASPLNASAAKDAVDKVKIAMPKNKLLFIKKPPNTFVCNANDCM
jgi:hypothetical protein